MTEKINTRLSRITLHFGALLVCILGLSACLESDIPLVDEKTAYTLPKGDWITVYEFNPGVDYHALKKVGSYYEITEKSAQERPSEDKLDSSNTENPPPPANQKGGKLR